jgi:hypothetical protein
MERKRAISIPPHILSKGSEDSTQQTRRTGVLSAVLFYNWLHSVLV